MILTNIDVVALVLTGLIGAAVSAFAAAIISYIKSSSHKVIKYDQEQQKNKCKEIATNVCSASWISREEEIRNIFREELRPVRKGLQSTLRHFLRQEGYRHLEKGNITPEELDDYSNIYHQYHNLGSNGVMDDLYEKIKNLPISNKDK